MWQKSLTKDTVCFRISSIPNKTHVPARPVLDQLRLAWPDGFVSLRATRSPARGEGPEGRKSLRGKEGFAMIRTLAKSIREYKKPSILAPVFVTGEVIMECIIPFIIANLVNEIKAGISMPVLLGYGGVLILMAGLSLAFGALAGKACSTASCGFARNLRKDMFYKIQGYSFENIDKFSVSSLV